MSLHPLKHVIKLLLAVSFPDYFKPAYDQFHLKQGVISLELFLDPGEYFDLSTDPDFRSLVINNHAEYVSEFEYEDVLLDEDLADLDQTALEELVVVDQVARQHELRLERRPDPSHPRGLRRPCGVPLPRHGGRPCGGRSGAGDGLEPQVPRSHGALRPGRHGV